MGFGYIAENQPVEQHAILRDPNGAAGTPLKSALKTPGTASRFLNPLSPTFREEQVLEKEEEKTEIQQAKDLVSFPTLINQTRTIKPVANQRVSTNRKSKPVFAWLK